MWMRDFYLKDGSRKAFYTNYPWVPKEVTEFVRENKGKIVDSFCDHLPWWFEKDEEILEYWQVACADDEEDEECEN